MRDEEILIFGDSYSTFAGYIPIGYDIYYPRAEAPTVDDVSKTWWHMLASETGSTIVLNNSWSGSTVCNTGYGGDCSKTSSFIHRLEELIGQGFFTSHRIDRVLVFGGTNDSWTGNAAGELMFSDWKQEDLFRVLPGISYFLHTLLSVIDRRQVHVIVNTDLRPEIHDGILRICEHFGISYTVLSDIEKTGGHPTYAGMIAIKNQVLQSLAVEGKV